MASSHDIRRLRVTYIQLDLSQVLRDTYNEQFDSMKNESAVLECTWFHRTIYEDYV